MSIFQNKYVSNFQELLQNNECYMFMFMFTCVSLFVCMFPALCLSVYHLSLCVLPLCLFVSSSMLCVSRSICVCVLVYVLCLVLCLCVFCPMFVCVPSYVCVNPTLCLYVSHPMFVCVSHPMFVCALRFLCLGVFDYGFVRPVLCLCVS